MGFNENLYKYLITKTELTDLIEKRIFTDLNTLNTLTSVYFQTISETEEETFESQEKVLTNRTIQFDTISKLRHKAEEVADVLRSILKNVKSTDFADIEVSAVIKINRFSSSERNPKTGEEYYIETLEYIISYYQ